MGKISRGKLRIAKAFKKRLLAVSFGDLMRKKSTQPIPKQEAPKPKKRYKYQIKWYA